MLKGITHFARAARAAFRRPVCDMSVSVDTAPREHLDGSADEDPMSAFKRRLSEIDKRCVQLAGAVQESNAGQVEYFGRHANVLWFGARDAYRQLAKPSPIRRAAKRLLESSRLAVLRQLEVANELLHVRESRTTISQLRLRLLKAEIEDSKITEAGP